MKQAKNLTQTDTAMAQAIMMKKRHRKISDIRQFFEYTQKRALEAGNEAVLDMDYETVLTYFKRLDKEGKGKILDIPGQPLRFEWYFRHDSIAGSLVDNDTKLVKYKHTHGSIIPLSAKKKAIAASRFHPAAKKAAPVPFKRGQVQGFVKNDFKKALEQSKPDQRRIAYIALRPSLILRLELPSDFGDKDRELINATLKAALV